MKHSLFFVFFFFWSTVWIYKALDTCILFLPPFPHAHRIKDPSGSSPYFNFIHPLKQNPQCPTSKLIYFQNPKVSIKTEYDRLLFPHKNSWHILFRHNIVCTLSRNIWLEPPLMKPKLIHYESEYKMLFLKRFIAILIAIICYIIQITVPYSHNMSYILWQSRVVKPLLTQQILQHSS